VARQCTVCTSEHRDLIDQGIVQGRSSYALADEYGVSPSAIQRHAKAHVSAALVALEVERTRVEAQTVLARMEAQYQTLAALIEQASKSGQAALVVNASRELRQTAELLAKITGELNDRPQVTVNLMASPEWLEVRALILGALTAYPDARTVVSGRLLELEAKES